MQSESSDFTGKLLIAMPGMSDPRFEKSVIFMCAHSDEGAMGLIVNKPAEDLVFADLLEQLSIKPAQISRDVPVHFGGPVEHGRGFVLHTSDYRSNTSTLEVDNHFGMTATLDILEDIASGQGPAALVMALGYAGWGPGQLESEIVRNGWLTCDASPEIVFSVAPDNKWEAALKTMGVEALTLSASAGRA
ncbi:MAG: YqgE/AlgH family protein [Pseudomonadota bacterium]